jgi:hypothetical protein
MGWKFSLTLLLAVCVLTIACLIASDGMAVSIA